MNPPKVLLAQLNSNGDCLYATVLARQIKEVDYPGCRLTWAVNSKSLQSISFNPYVDEVWEISTASSLTTQEEWLRFVQQAEARKARGDFDIIHYTQIIGDNLVRLDGSVRSSIYSNYPFPITVSQQPIIRLSAEENENVRAFALANGFEKYSTMVLMECGPDSFSSSLNPAACYAFAEALAAKYPAMGFILSSNKKLPAAHPHIFDASLLSFRENAALTYYANLFIGCSSGISWLATTDWAKPLPKIIINNPDYYLNTSMLEDHLQANLPVDDVLEISEGKNVMPILKEAVETYLSKGFVEARQQFHQPYKRRNFKFLSRLTRKSFELGMYSNPFHAYKKAVARYGFHINALVQLLKAYIIKFPIAFISNLFREKAQ